jgi:hypothetical protein
MAQYSLSAPPAIAAYFDSGTGKVLDTFLAVDLEGGVYDSLQASYPGFTYAAPTSGAAGSQSFAIFQSKAAWNAENAISFSPATSLTIATLASIAPAPGDRILMSAGGPYGGKWIVATVLSVPA